MLSILMKEMENKSLLYCIMSWNLFKWLMTNQCMV